MGILRRAPLVVTTINLEPAEWVSVRVDAAQARWPRYEAVDRFVVPLGIAAVALSRAPDELIEVVRRGLSTAARAIATTSGADERELVAMLSGLRLGGPGEGTVRILARLIRSPLGPVPSVGGGHGPLSLAVAASATLGVCMAPLGSATRLASALCLEGLLGWYRFADPHLQPPQQALAYALRHAAARLAEEGKPLPDELAIAVETHRKISPMAGGA